MGNAEVAFGTPGPPVVLTVCHGGAGRRSAVRPHRGFWNAHGAPKVSVSCGVPSAAWASCDQSQSTSVPSLVSATL